MRKSKVAMLAALAIIAAATAMFILRGQAPPAAEPARPKQPETSSMQTMEVAKAVMVTVELDFGPKVPTVAEALTQIERRYAPDDGRGRTFAILSAYGEPTKDGKLHMSMHISSEKPGLGRLIFKPTGQVLWETRIVPRQGPPPSDKNLLIYISDAEGGQHIIDGSSNPSSILDATVKDLGVAVRDFWPDGAEREVIFIYSACGCPVKVMARRVGSRTERTSDLPVIFPDDPPAVSTIARLMRW